MDAGSRKKNRYSRIRDQLGGLLTKTDDRITRMATVIAVLHHKMDGFFWTGFYILKNGRLLAGPYQGPLACQELELEKGVCWAAVCQNRTLVVDDVHKFPGHIACDPQSKSEIVVPVRDGNRGIIAVLDIDSDSYANFDEIDAEELEKIVEMITV